jgi:hypothetical protein
MAHRFNKHYTREEARKLLPRIRKWLEALEEGQMELEKNDRRLAGLMTEGQDMGGALVNKWVTILAEIRQILREFEEREIIIKDLARGLIDFPALIGDKEVFLCWEKDEDDIEYWHDIDSGYAGREPL